MSKVLRSYNALMETRWVPPATLLCPGPLPAPEIQIAPLPDFDAIAAEARRKAAQEAEAIIATARCEAERIRQQAYEEGLASGREDAKREYDTQLTELNTMVDHVNHERDAFFETAEPELVRLSVAIAEKVIAQQLSLKPEIIVNLTRSHMKRIREREVLRIRINPDDMPLLSDARQALLNDVDGVREIHLFDDRRVKRGSVVIEAETGSLDARIPSQIDVITKALEEALEGPYGETDA
ncbi:MAG: FliH/SctL family protein [Armatimonadota bacterium]